MKYVELINMIKTLALKQPNVHTFVREFEDLNREDVKYSSIILQDETHNRKTNINGDFMQYGFYIGYADRLTADEGNRDEVIGSGIEAINNILNALYLSGEVDVTCGNLIPFNQRFTAQCAGSYMKITITVPIDECAIDYDFHGDYNKDYDTDYNN